MVIARCRPLYHRGVIVNRKRVQRLMGLLSIQTLYSGPNTSMQNKSYRYYPYLLRNLLIETPNKVWTIDITYIRLYVGMVYLFALIDWFSRFIVGGGLAYTREEEHALEAFRQGLQYGGLIFAMLIKVTNSEEQLDEMN